MVSNLRSRGVDADKDPLGENCMARILAPRRVGTSVKKGPLVDISTGEVS